MDGQTDGWVEGDSGPGAVYLVSQQAGSTRSELAYNRNLISVWGPGSVAPYLAALRGRIGKVAPHESPWEFCSLGVGGGSL